MTEAMLILGAVAVLTAVLTIRSSRKEVEKLDKEEEYKRRLKSFNDYCLTKEHIDYNSNSPMPTYTIRGKLSNVPILYDDFPPINQEELNTVLGAYIYTKDGEKVWRDDVKVIKISSDMSKDKIDFVLNSHNLCSVNTVGTLPEYMEISKYNVTNIDDDTNEETTENYSLDITQEDIDLILDEIPSYIIHEERSREPFITNEEAPEYMGYFESKITSYEPVDFNDNSNEENTIDTTESEELSWD